MSGLEEKLSRAVADGALMESAAANIASLLGGAPSPLYDAVVSQLAIAGEWRELNDRFYKTLAFGTGGLRGRTIGRIVTPAERGSAASDLPPEFPCVGTNAMNYYNVARATRGLVAYLKERFDKPKLVIAHDTRFFSKQFADLAAKVAAENSCDAFVFTGPRSTPELSFAVRYLNASAGVVVTASHNPPHDNGYKVYFNDGAQVVEPDASAIIAKVNAISGEAGTAAGPQGSVRALGSEIDEAYMQRLETLILDRELLRSQHDLRIVFTPIHGTGGVIVKPMLQRLGFAFSTVPEQDEFDGAFPTVKSPNPENAEALTLAIELARKQKADLVVATDPDCDRMGVAVLTAAASEGGAEMKLMTGNQIGSLLAFYRVKTLFDRGVLNKANASRGVIIKTFVTTDLQKAIAERYGLRCVETLTGFKYIGAKLARYERELMETLRSSPHLSPLTEGEEDRAAALGSRQSSPGVVDYRALTEEQSRDLRLRYSSFYIFGGEESYGYSGADFVRDKDANGAVVMFCEVAAYAKSRKITLDQLLDEVFTTFGYFQEKNGAITFEGAQGAEIIKRLLASYVSNPPGTLLESKVARVRNFETETIHDIEGDEIPKEKMLIFELEDRTRIAVRGSGTEPKIKYYLFAQEQPPEKGWSATELQTVKQRTTQRLDALWNWIQQDAQARATP